MPADAATRILITGGAGFIGTAVVRQLIAETQAAVINVDKLTYAGNPESLGAARHHERHSLIQTDIGNTAAMRRIFREHRPDAVMHLAAESHVDRSILGPDAFIDTNVVGTGRLLTVACDYWRELTAPQRAAFRFHHVSTDEVYGDLGLDDPAFAETTPYAPSSPYSASKAASDHLVRAWHRTYGLPVVLSNCSNNYGPYQFPEKLIPLMILNALQGEALPVYGRGENVRDWLYVEDHARALRRVLTDGEVGRTYNIGGRAERRNIDVVRGVCRLLDEARPDPAGPYERLIRFVTDRPGHDHRYAIDSRRIETELDWRPSENFEAGLAKTVHWYLDHAEWVARVRSGAYRDWIQRNYATRGAS